MNWADDKEELPPLVEINGKLQLLSVETKKILENEARDITARKNAGDAAETRTIKIIAKPKQINKDKTSRCK